MELQMEQKTLDVIRQYRLPRYADIPNVGLYLNQVAKFINEYMEPFQDMDITESMISNYVKKRLVVNPVKKQYGREQIAYLIFIAVAKSVLPLNDIQILLDIQKENYESQVAYDYFCSEFENVLQYVFGVKDSMDEIGTDETDAKSLLHNVIITVAHKIYLEQCFFQLSENKAR